MSGSIRRKEWHIQNTAQFMQDKQEWNALVPSTAVPATDYATAPKGQGGLGLPAGTTLSLTYTNVLRPDGQDASTVQHRERPGGPGSAHSCRQAYLGIPGPASAPADLRQEHPLSFGAYFANYTQDNHWYFTQILTDVADQTHFLDAVVTPPGGAPDSVTKNGFVNQLSGYNNGSGQTSVISGVLGGEIQLTDRLRADIGVRGEYDKFVQSSENTSTFDLDGDPTTTYNNETFGNSSFRHFDRGHQRLVGVAGTQLHARVEVLALRGRARGATRCPRWTSS